jgi:hypothetical protein
MHTRQYRDTVYRLRSHPHTPEVAFGVDRRDSFTMIYVSFVPFAGLEYAAEYLVSSIPAGLVFPMGFLLYWAFYYTYYRPGALETRLQRTSFFNALNLFHMLVGTAIWLVKITVVYVGELLLSMLWAPAKTAESASPPLSYVFKQTPPPFEKPAHANTATFPQPEPLPEEARQALAVLGLSQTSDWTEIHRRYRLLAKKFHPDLNPEITESGSHFIRFDVAYKRLLQHRNRYFHVKTGT